MSLRSFLKGKAIRGRGPASPEEPRVVKEEALSASFHAIPDAQATIAAAQVVHSVPAMVEEVRLEPEEDDE